MLCPCQSFLAACIAGPVDGFSSCARRDAHPSTSDGVVVVDGLFARTRHLYLWDDMIQFLPSVRLGIDTAAEYRGGGASPPMIPQVLGRSRVASVIYLGVLRRPSTHFRDCRGRQDVSGQFSRKTEGQTTISAFVREIKGLLCFL